MLARKTVKLASDNGGGEKQPSSQVTMRKHGHTFDNKNKKEDSKFTDSTFWAIRIMMIADVASSSTTLCRRAAAMLI